MKLCKIVYFKLVGLSLSQQEFSRIVCIQGGVTMPTKPKIKIIDNNELRKEIDEIYENMNQINVAKWSLSMAKHILKIVNILDSREHLTSIE